MTNKIMELVHHAIYAEESYVLSEYIDKIQAILEAQQDYTRAVINERDAYKTSLKATKGEVYRLLSERDALLGKIALQAVQQGDMRDVLISERDSLRKAAQMALEALSDIYAHSHTNLHMKQIIEALRKELGQ